MSKPSILLVPGSFSLPSLYDNVVNAVAEKGYEIHALHHPSVGLAPGVAREGTPATMYDDAAHIATEIEKLADEGKDVVLVAHSYGGVPTTESTKGLGKKERLAQGKVGGVVRLAYLSSLVPEVGMPAAGVLADKPQGGQPDLRVDEKGWMWQEPVHLWAPITFSDLPQEEGEAWSRKFPPHSAISFGGPLTHAGYKDIPASWLLCEDDLIIPAEYQRKGIERIEEASGAKVDVTSIKAGHCPSASAPQKVIDWILDVAGKV